MQEMKLALLSFAFLIICLPLIAFAGAAGQEIAQQHSWQVVLVWFLGLVRDILVPIIGTVILIQLRKHGIHVDEDKLNAAVDEAIGMVEERAAAALKNGAEKTDSGAKLEWALGKVMEIIEENKLKRRTSKYVTDKIEARLGLKRMNGGADASTPAPASA